MDPKDLMLFHLRESGFYAFYCSRPEVYVIKPSFSTTWASAGIWVFRSRVHFWWCWLMKSMSDDVSLQRFAVINRYVELDVSSPYFTVVPVRKSDTEIEVEVFSRTMPPWPERRVTRYDLADPTSLDRMNQLLRLSL